MSAFISGAGNDLQSSYSTPAAQDITMMCWFMLPASTVAYRTIIAANVFGPNGPTIQTNTDGQTLDFRSLNGGAPSNLGPLLTFGVWYHAAMSVRNTATRPGYVVGYLNGQRIVTATDTVTVYGAITSVDVGNASAYANLFPLNGNVRDVRMWNRVLNDEEVKIEFSYGIPVRTQGLVIWSLFDDDLRTDRSGNGNLFTTTGTVTLQNGPSKRKWPGRGAEFIR